LKLKRDILLSKSAFNFNLRRYTPGMESNRHQLQNELDEDLIRDGTTEQPLVDECNET